MITVIKNCSSKHLRKQRAADSFSYKGRKSSHDLLPFIHILNIFNSDCPIQNALTSPEAIKLLNLYAD